MKLSDLPQKLVIHMQVMINVLSSLAQERKISTNGLEKMASLFMLMYPHERIMDEFIKHTHRYWSLVKQRDVECIANLGIVLSKHEKCDMFRPVVEKSIVSARKDGVPPKVWCGADDMISMGLVYVYNMQKQDPSYFKEIDVVEFCDKHGMSKPKILS